MQRVYFCQRNLIHCFFKRLFSYGVAPLRLQFLFTYFSKYWVLKSIMKLLDMLLFSLLNKLQILDFFFFFNAGLFWKHALILILNLSENMTLVILCAHLAVFIAPLIWFGSKSFFPFKKLHQEFSWEFICLMWVLKQVWKNISFKAVISTQQKQQQREELWCFFST